MARGATAEAEQATATEGEQQDGEQKPKRAANPNRSYIVVPMPPNMKKLFEDEAGDKAVGPYVRDLLAQQRGIEIPKTEVSRRHKYANEEEKKAALKAQRKSRSDLIKQLMAEHRAKTAAQNGQTAGVEQPAEAAPASA